MINKIINQAGDPNVSGSGHFLLGSPAIFFFDFPDIDGVLYDPSNITVTITDPNDDTVKTCDSLDRLETGRYVLEWSIPSDLQTGKYTATLDYTAETDDGPVDREHIEYFVISEAETAYLDQYVVGMSAILETFIGETQRIPVYDEIGRLNLERTIASFSFERWNQPAGSIVRVNGTPIQLAHSVDYNKGKIHFNVPLSSVDEITCSYNFRYFSDSELYSFINQSTQIFNQYPPQNSFLPSTLPDRFRITVILQAAVFTIRRLLMDILYQKPAKIYGGMDRADKVFSSLDQLKKNYEDQLKELYQAKLKQPYIGLTKTISTPEFTLPGGRSRWFRYLFKGA